MNLLFRCDHEKRKSAVSCITRIIGENNSEHFFVATQDAELQKKFKRFVQCFLLHNTIASSLSHFMLTLLVEH